MRLTLPVPCSSPATSGPNYTFDRKELLSAITAWEDGVISRLRMSHRPMPSVLAQQQMSGLRNFPFPPKSRINGLAVHQNAFGARYVQDDLARHPLTWADG